MRAASARSSCGTGASAGGRGLRLVPLATVALLVTACGGGDDEEEDEEEDEDD